MRGRRHGSDADDAIAHTQCITPGAPAVPRDAGELAAHRAVVSRRRGRRDGGAAAARKRSGRALRPPAGPATEGEVALRGSASSNTLDVRSEDGLEGVATDCRMDFCDRSGRRRVDRGPRRCPTSRRRRSHCSPRVLGATTGSRSTCCCRAHSRFPLVRQKRRARPRVLCATVDVALGVQIEFFTGRRHAFLRCRAVALRSGTGDTRCRPGSREGNTHYVCYWRAPGSLRMWAAAAWVRRPSAAPRARRCVSKRPAAAWSPRAELLERSEFLGGFSGGGGGGGGRRRRARRRISWEKLCKGTNSFKDISRPRRPSPN